MATGTVKWWNDDKGFGFITQDGGGPDVFAHFSEIDRPGFRTLAENERVEFEITQGQKGPQARNIRPLGASSGASGSAKGSGTKSTGSHREPPTETGEPLLVSDPRAVGSYLITRRLGEGAMGTVYLAQDSAGTKVALKVVRAEFARDESFRQRFIKEVANARRVQDFCTAAVLHADIDHERPFLVTEFIDGPTLAEQVRVHGPLPRSQVHGLAIGIAAALVAIHSAGVVHRDLKPSNVMLSHFGPKVIDFGIARSLDSTTVVTQNMTRLGTPAYMSPEQVENGNTSVNSDIFSWGGVVIFAATGTEPFGQGHPLSIMFQIIEREPNLDGLPSRLRDIVRDAMTKNPEARPSAQALLSLLTSLRP